MIVTGAVGKVGSGKDVVMQRISKKFGWPIYSIGDIARNLAMKENVQPTRENLHNISKKYMTAFGDYFFVDAVIAEIREHKQEFVVISGIRPYSDVHRFKEAFGSSFVLVHVAVSDDRLRLNRMRDRGSERDPLKIEDLIAQDDSEERLFEVSKSVREADCVIVNDGSLDDLDKEIDNFAKVYLRISGE
jgi:dephospho-CoA kinase